LAPAWFRVGVIMGVTGGPDLAGFLLACLLDR
jgi:hypothetical protein